MKSHNKSKTKMGYVIFVIIKWELKGIRAFP